MKVRAPKDFSLDIEEQDFDPKLHLQLEEPDTIWSLRDFGYSKEQEEAAPFPLAVCTPFRILSPSGVEMLNKVIKSLHSQSRTNDRIANFIRGGLYHSKFLRGLCASPEVNSLIAKIAGKPILPHPMTLYQGHINLMPKTAGRDVDKWHTDTVALDYVLLATSPDSFSGGHFEYVKTTKAKAIRSLIREEAAPDIVKVEFPEAGYAVLQQGNLVMHRGTKVISGTERTTLVQSFIPDAANFRDVSKLDDCKPVDPPEVLFTEWARYKAFLSQRRLASLLDTIPYTTDKNEICMQLRLAIRDVEEAVLEISDPLESRLVHFGQDALTDPG